MTVNDSTPHEGQNEDAAQPRDQTAVPDINELLDDHSVHTDEDEFGAEFAEIEDRAHLPPSYRWERRARQLQFWFRLTALVFLSCFLIGWPLGTSWAEYEQTGIFRFRLGFSLPVFLYMMTVPILIFVIGYILSLGFRMAGKAEELELSASRLIRPDAHAAGNIQAVGTAVRGHIESLNSHIDDALTKLASVESMIRQQVKAIDVAAETMQSNSDVNIQKIATERQQLMDLTEHLNIEAGRFAEAIAEKAKLGLESSETANTRIAGAERELESRLSQLDDTAQKALTAFEQLTTTLQQNEETIYESSARLDTLSLEANQKSSFVTRLIDENAIKLLQAQQKLEAEGKQLERLISDQRERVGKLAKTIAQQTEENPEINAAMEKLNGIETMIQRQIETLDNAATAMQTASGESEERFKQQQQNLIGLTEHLNLEAENFAAAIAEKARQGIAASEEVNARLASAEADLDSRINRLEAASEQTLSTFDKLAANMAEKEVSVSETTLRLTDISGEANQQVNRLSDIIDSNASGITEAQQRLAEESERLELLITEQRERAERLGQIISQQTSQDISLDETLGKLASVESMIRQQIDAINNASAAMQEASGESAQRLTGERQQLIDLTESLNREADNLADVIADKAKQGTAQTDAASIRLTSAEKELGGRLGRLEEKADQALSAFSRLSESLSEREATVSQTNEHLERINSEASQKTSDMARLMEQNASAITAAQERLSAESKRLEELIEEQQQRADKLAETIAEQTERLSKLSEQTREQTTKAPSSFHGSPKPLVFSRIEPSDRVSRANTEPTPPGRQPLQALTIEEVDEEIPSPRQTRFEKSWRDILAAADQPEEPLTLGGVGLMEPKQKSQISAASDDNSNVIDLVRQMQGFMMSLERDLYGKPQQAVVSRFENGERNIFANIILRRDEESVKDRIRLETSRNEDFKTSVYEFLENFDQLLEPATGEKDGDNLIDDYLGSPIGQVYLIVGSAMDYFS